MPTLIRDLETRSTVDLSKAGAWKYSASPETEVLCCAYCVDDGPVKLWTPGDAIPPEVIKASNDPAWLTSAFNDSFERSIERHILNPRYGWPLAPIERHRCLQASALALALPAKLETVAIALGLEFQKDHAGRLNMLALSKPRKPKKGEPASLYWHDDAARIERLYAYCIRDVLTERALYNRIGFLPPDEQAIWLLDAAINDRGICIDADLASGAIKIVEAAHAEIDAELKEITKGEVSSFHQSARLIAWLGSQGCVVTDLQKPTLNEAIAREDTSESARRAMELRLLGAHAAAGKFAAMLAWRNPDGRVRGCFRFHGASTGRWSSLGVQLQNFKRPIAKDIGPVIEAITSGDLGNLKKLSASPLSLVGDAARAALCAAPGHRLIAADFSGIESRVLAWLAGEKSKLAQWVRFDATGCEADDPYRILGLRFGLPADRVRSGGKTGDLAFGYQGGVGAYRALAPGDPSTDEEVKRLRDAWREAHPATVRFWRDLNRAAVGAVQTPGTIFKVNEFISFRCDAPFLRMKLPSGRKLFYPFPSLKIDSRGGHAVSYLDAQMGRFVECRNGRGAYGGVWAENSVSAVARDLLASAMLRLEAAGYPIVAHVHDEAIAQVPIGFGRAEEFRQILIQTPSWAAALPVAAKVREGPRFVKTTAPDIAVVVATPMRLVA